VNCLSISGKEHKPHAGPCVSSPLVQRLLKWDEQDQSLTYRELLGVWDCYVKKAESFAGSAVLHLCDNMNVETILRKGSGKPLLQKLAFEIFLACRKHQIFLSAQWLPRTDCRIAIVDVLSKWADLDDWGVSENEFRGLASICNTFDIDLFGADYNFRGEKFFSPVPSQFGIGLNAFSFDWKQFGFGFLCPPVKKIAAAIKHAVMCRAEGVMIVPFWPTSLFWKFLASDGRHLTRMFVNHKATVMEVRSGPLGKSKMFAGVPSFRMLTLHYDAEVFEPLVPNLRSYSCLYSGCSVCR
jgi:hypothetical protein